MRSILNGARIAVILVLAFPVSALADYYLGPGIGVGQASAPLVVVAGRGVGQWTVDRTLADYVFMMGAPEVLVADQRPSGADLVFRPQLEERSWSTPRIFVVYPTASNTVWAVGTSEPGAHTIDRVGVGSTEQQLSAAYQTPQSTLDLPVRSRTLIYDTRGIAFEFAYVPATGGFSPTAGRVFVFRPGQAKGIWRIP